jgi:hypothetical protein
LGKIPDGSFFELTIILKPGSVQAPEVVKPPKQRQPKQERVQMAKAKTKSKKAKGVARKRGATAKTQTTSRERRPGRRPEPTPKVKGRHEKALKSRVDRLNKKEQEVQDEKNELAREIDEATADDCSTTWICETVGKSRQTVFKLVAERVDGKQLNPNWGKGKKGIGKSKASTPAKAKKEPVKKETPKPKPKPKPAPKKAAARKAAKSKSSTKAPKAPAKPNGRAADPAGLSKGKVSKVKKHPARKPLPKRPMRPRPKA